MNLLEQRLEHRTKLSEKRQQVRQQFCWCGLWQTDFITVTSFLVQQLFVAVMMVASFLIMMAEAW